jgi:DNA-directed RNA polymerase specialized sigma24 family protein
MTVQAGEFQVAAVVAAARAGDRSAWSELVSRFQDAAVGLAVAHGHWSDADDVAQEAFMLAMRNLGSLSDPQAFPAWFATLVRTASSRRRRENRPTLGLVGRR